jgi:hypothetical protein
MHSLVNSVSTVELVLLFVVAGVALSVGGILLAEWALPNLRTGTFAAGANNIRLAFRGLFGLILALTVAGLVANGFVANNAVSDEATTLAQLTRASQTLNVTDRRRMKAAIGQYVHAVAEDEFATMRDGQASPLAAAALASLYSVGSQSAGARSALSKIDQLTALRRKRLAISDHSLSPLFQFMLVIGVIFYIVMVYPPAIEKRLTRLASVGAMAAFLSLVLVIAAVLDAPFAGELATSNQPYKEAALATFWPAI